MIFFKWQGCQGYPSSKNLGDHIGSLSSTLHFKTMWAAFLRAILMLNTVILTSTLTRPGNEKLHAGPFTIPLEAPERCSRGLLKSTWFGSEKQKNQNQNQNKTASLSLTSTKPYLSLAQTKPTLSWWPSLNHLCAHSHLFTVYKCQGTLPSKATVNCPIFDT
jgi:hypothetical protein